MVKQWLSWANLSMIALSVALILAALGISFIRPSNISVSDAVFAKRPLPLPSFSFPKSAYEDIGQVGCQLKFAPITLQLPDLRSQLVYHGRNGRPDAQLEKPVLHFGFANNSNSFTVAVGEKAYLKYDRTRVPAQYVCQTEGETPLWIEVDIQGNDAVVAVAMRDENGNLIRDPTSLAEFTLNEREVARTGGRVWEMDKWRVDGSLLARQKARWMGKDSFLARHGGDEFKELAEKHRIDFSDDDANYSLYVGPNDCAIWDEGKWKVVQPGAQSLKHPLMTVKKIDDRIMTFELWDVGGKQKIPLTLIRINEPWTYQNLQEKFVFLGARTRSQYIFEIDDQRILLSPKDWLLQTEEGWIKLATAQQIDDYVDRKLTGVLFVFDGVVREEGRQILKGVVFNSARNEMQELDIPVQQGPGGAAIADDFADEDEEEDDDDDDDEDND